MEKLKVLVILIALPFLFTANSCKPKRTDSDDVKNDSHGGKYSHHHKVSHAVKLLDWQVQILKAQVNRLEQACVKKKHMPEQGL